MDKKTKMWLGVAALGAAGYLVWKKMQPKAGFANAMGKSAARFQVVAQCKGTTGKQVTLPDGNKYWDCCQMGYVTANKPSEGCASAV